ncbi:hypothetical protein [Cerasicoccus fimbriatus]|uniref:hypothetical protein n=1 Tax=Cerasicoccus fimbriatus TaxID=3014554 RepID=UPI0022B3DD04|nr:hypothetical protein [Cerasicoccus sp. TK19100]
MSLAFYGCSDDQQEATIAIAEKGQPARTINIIVEGKENVIIEDPYIEEIETLSAEYMEQRSRYIKEHESMTREERKAFGELRDQTGSRVQELQSLRKKYIIEKMKEHGGIDFKVEASAANGTRTTGSDYFKGIQDSQ